VTIQPYLYFAGRADEAITFYQKVFGAELQMLLRFKDSPDPAPPGVIVPGWENKVMHSSLKIGESIVLASDGCGSDDTAFKGFGLSYAVKDVAEADRIFAALADGGQVKMPLGKTFFSPRFGMVEDRFGVLWIVILPA
jgi:PhnB protein